MPAGTISQTARGGDSLEARSCGEVAPTAVDFASFLTRSSVSCTTLGSLSSTTTWCPAFAIRTTMFWPMRPKPTMPSCTAHAPFIGVQSTPPPPPRGRREEGQPVCLAASPEGCAGPKVQPAHPSGEAAKRSGAGGEGSPPLSLRHQLEPVVADQDRVRHPQEQAGAH